MIKKILITIVVLILIVVIGFICKDIVETNTYADDDRFNGRIHIGFRY